MKISNKLTIGLAVLALFSLIALSSNASAEIKEITVKEIQINGNKRIESDTIKAFLEIYEGQKVSPQKLDEMFRKTFKTGLFKDLEINIQGNKLIVDVVENPVVFEVSIEGNDKISDDKILPELIVKPRYVFKKSDTKRDISRILAMYQRNGRYNVKVDVDIKELENQRIAVTYKIDEGKRTKVSQISFVNNNNYDEAILEAEISTKESRWYRFFSGSDNYDPDRLEHDKELLRRFYMQNGFADFRVVSADAELDRNDASFNIIFTVDEGAYYQFGEVKIDSAIGDINYDEAYELLNSRSNEEFDNRLVENSITKLTDYLGEKGYAFVEIMPKFVARSEDGKMDVTYKITEGPKVYINRINISGNSRTKDKVIRREFRVDEGDPYNASRIKRSKQRIEGLGFFSDVKLENKQLEDSDRVDIDIAVKEQSTGEISFGAGFSSSDGVLGDIGITERNLLGNGQYMKLNFTMASARQQIDLGFTEPYFLDENFSAGFNIFNTKINGGSSVNNLSFDNSSTGLVLQGSYPLTEYITHSVNYTIRNDDISDIDSTASLFIQLQEGERLTSSLGQSISYNTLDNQFLPNSGVYASLSQEFAGLGGDVNYLKHEGRLSYFNQIFREYPDVVLRLSGRAGNIFGLSDDVRVNNNFFLGGTLLRGFQNQGIGPRDSNTDDAIGGKNYYTTTAELMFPLGLPEELQIKGAVFADAGSLWSVDKPTSTTTINVQDDSSIRSSIGTGVFWRSPVGPIRIDFSKAITKEDYDETETFRFSFGTRF